MGVILFAKKAEVVHKTYLQTASDDAKKLYQAILEGKKAFVESKALAPAL